MLFGEYYVINYFKIELYLNVNVIIQAVYDLWYTLYISLKHMSFTLSLYSFVYIQYRSFSSEYFTPKLLLLCREEVTKTQTKHFIAHLVGVIIRNIQILLRIWPMLILIAWFLLRYIKLVLNRLILLYLI